MPSTEPLCLKCQRRDRLPGGHRAPGYISSPVVLTHPQEDHITGLVDVVSRYNVGEVLDSGQECDTPTCQAWNLLIEEKQIPYRRADAGTRIDIGEEVRLHVLHPPATLLAPTSSDVNNNSLVLRLEYGGFSATLTAETQQGAEEALLSHRPATEEPGAKCC